MADPIEVKLVPHVGTQEVMTPAGLDVVEVEHDQYMVYVHSVGIANADKKLQVGLIGKQPGANFCPITAFYRFSYPQQQLIASEAKRLHGSANPAPHVDVPPPEVQAWDDDLEESDEEESE